MIYAWIGRKNKMYAFEQWILLFERPNEMWSNGTERQHEELRPVSSAGGVWGGGVPARMNK